MPVSSEPTVIVPEIVGSSIVGAVPVMSPWRWACHCPSGLVGRRRSFGVPVSDFTFLTLNQILRFVP